MPVCPFDDMYVGLLMTRAGLGGAINPSDRFSVVKSTEERLEFGAHHDPPPLAPPITLGGEGKGSCYSGAGSKQRVFQGARASTSYCPETF